MRWPTKRYWISAGYTKPHQAIDFASIGGRYGQKIIAPVSGVVTAIGTNPNYIGGLYIIIKDNEGYQHYTGHHQRIRVKVGQKVREGQHIADMGKTGIATGPHTHYQIRNSKGNLINPKTLYNERRKITMDKKDLDRLHQLTFHRKVGKDAGGQNYLNKYSGSKLSTVLDYLLSHASYKSLVKRNVDYTRLETNVIDLSEEQKRLRQENSDVKTLYDQSQETSRKLTRQANILEAEVAKLEKANTKLNEENIRLKKDVTVKQAISVIIDKIVSLIRR